MGARNTESAFGWVAKGLHWIVAVAIIAAIVIGEIMGDMAPSLDKLEMYNLHKSIGMTVLVLVLARLAWRLINPVPRPLGTVTWQNRAAHWAHVALYACMLAMPVLGWLMSSAANTPVNVFGLIVLPNLIGADKGLAELFAEIHETVGHLLIILILVHMGAALKHHLIDRDETLRRMLPARREANEQEGGP